MVLSIRISTANNMPLRRRHGSSRTVSREHAISRHRHPDSPIRRFGFALVQSAPQRPPRDSGASCKPAGTGKARRCSLQRNGIAPATSTGRSPRCSTVTLTAARASGRCHSCCFLGSRAGRRRSGKQRRRHRRQVSLQFSASRAAGEYARHPTRRSARPRNSGVQSDGSARFGTGNGRRRSG